ncbi:MAG TPA: DEAD/DEAH box helicase family protein [Chthoniobacteraceae bacterium]|jgi:type III restriction enzyme
MIQLKEYQLETLKAVRLYLEKLAELRAKDAKARTVDPDLGFDWPAKAWEKIETGRTYFPRKNGLKQPLPSFCLKIPTGGGKTLLATKAIDLINTHFRKSNRGLVLWVVPTTQIYNQTLAALKDRDHPYRQTLDNASGARTLILERTQHFTPLDIEGNLCVLLLMLPAAARQTKETLRMFRDSGGFDAFFPSEEDYAGHTARLNELPNLDTFDTSEFSARQIKTSLGNTLRTLSPLIILDEGQKAYSQLARETIEGFNPCMIVELSATPPQGANVLVDVKGTALEREGMIKLDLHVHNDTSVDWKKTLLNAAERRDLLEEQAREHEAQTGKYIRPICLIQVERTGKEQRGGKYIHAEDVREYLHQRHGVTADMVAIKTSEKDELKEVDDLGGLLSKNTPIRYIITKQALQEGWDCPFAYVLAVLTNPGSKTALTQLVGRILRQPDGRKTGNRWLDESYVYCFQRKGGALLEDIRKGFGAEGLGDLKGRIIDETSRTDRGGELQIFPRERFRGQAEHLVLPAFMIKDGKEWRPVHYEPDILARVPWGDVNIEPLLNLQLPDEDTTGRHTRHGLGRERILQQEEEIEVQGARLELADDAEPDCAFAASHLLEVMPNPWRGNEIARKVFANLSGRYERRRLLDSYVFVLDEMHRRLLVERDRLARQVFHELLNDGTMRFMVVTDEFAWRLPKVLTMPEMEPRANSEIGKDYQLSLFEDMPASGFNGLERAVATFLDAQEQLFFWYRNRSRHDYFVQGWQPNRIYADFIFTTAREAEEESEIDRVFVVETKGKHLAGVKDAEGKLTDTGYKRDVFDVCSRLATETNWGKLVPFMTSRTMRFEVVDEERWKSRLNELLLS